eukprot:GEMP01081570.1.p2 GENE.GEMP01081570.1~~GEMP01081570.1.p2  ORF type:complete len:102 (+),score=6.32 GEMP01081570.1:254-559(+)
MDTIVCLNIISTRKDTWDVTIHVNAIYKKLSTFENAAPTLLPTRAYPKTLILELCYFVRYFFVAPRRGPRVFIIILAAQKMRSRICLCHFHSFFVVVLSGL